MRLMSLFSLLCLLLSSCSLPLAKFSGGLVEMNNKESRLMNIRIERWGELLFSGLLALREQQDGLYYTLLDATGVTLVEAQVTSDGRHNVIRANDALKKKGLDAFLSEVLARIYLLQPKQLPCSRNLLLKFCYQQESWDDKREKKAEWHKNVSAGPVNLWRAAGNKKEDGRDLRVTYSQPWLGIRISLEGLR